MLSAPGSAGAARAARSGRGGGLFLGLGLFVGGLAAAALFVAGAVAGGAVAGGVEHGLYAGLALAAPAGDLRALSVGEFRGLLVGLVRGCRIGGRFRIGVGAGGRGRLGVGRRLFGLGLERLGVGGQDRRGDVDVGVGLDVRVVRAGHGAHGGGDAGL